MKTYLRSEYGSVLIIAVIAMLVLGILSFSFALLSRIEMTTGVNYKLQAQAEALAEAGLERGRDEVRAAAAEGCGFTKWTDPGGSSSYGCGPGLAKLLFNGVSLGAGTYSVVIDNDCNSPQPLVPASLQDTSCPGGRDTNETAILTAWATTTNGQGRARVRAVLGIDNPWKHVCSNSSQDNYPGYCNEPGNRNGNPSIVPADPNEYPGGPAAYDDLPRPQLGCSAIDPTLHSENALNCPPGQNYSYPYPVGKRLVVQGDRSKGNCDAGGVQYQGYFDCALSTPCPAAICGGSGRPACVKPGDTRTGANYVKATAPGVCAAAVPPATGMVFTGAVDWPVNYGSAGNGIPVYVMRPGDFTIQSRTLYGTVVVEGNGSSGCGGSRDVWHKNGSVLTTSTNVYGYPLAYLIFDPVEAVANAPEPTANPLDPQETCADMGSASGTTINGIVYSGGNVEFNPIVVNGGVVAFQIQTQSSSSSYSYNNTYGNAAPPPGFPDGSGNTVVLVRKSFIVCGDYAADSGGGTSCR
jgi:hypothetical protein